jgi:hypothetical protein
VDSDRDGRADGCDPCPLDSHDDSDGASVCDSIDSCPGFDDRNDRNDRDGDGIADGCDPPEPSQCVTGAVGPGVIDDCYATQEPALNSLAGALIRPLP